MILLLKDKFRIIIHKITQPLSFPFRYYLKNAILQTGFQYGYHKKLSRLTDKSYDFERDKHPIRRKHHGKGGWSMQLNGEFHYRDYSSYDEYVTHQVQKLDEILKMGGFSNHTILTYRRTFYKRFNFLPRILPKTANILCLGARQGTEVEVLRDIGYKNAMGIDLNPGPDNPWVVKGDFMSLDYDNRSLDMVYSNCIDHAFDINSFFQENARVLKPNGIAIYDIAMQSGTGGGPFESVEWKSEETVFLAALKHFNKVLRVDTDRAWKWILLQK